MTPLERLKAYQAEAQSPDLALLLAVVDAAKDAAYVVRLPAPLRDALTALEAEDEA